MTVNELIKELQQISAEGGGDFQVFYTRPSDICRRGADENFVECVYYSGIETEGKTGTGVQLS